MTSPSAVISRQPEVVSASDVAGRRERRFFTGISIALAAVVFAGFAPSYFLKVHFGAAPLSPVIHVHGILFTAWIGLLIAQSSLIAAGRVSLHRKLGIASVVLAVMLVASGAMLIYGLGKKEIPGVPHDMILGFAGLAFVTLLLFPSLIGAALLFRRKAGAHKRLMVLGTIVMVGAAVHRLLMWSYDPAVTPPVFFGATDLFIVGLGVYDLISRGRLHAATLWGGLYILVAQIGSLFLAGSKTWLAFAHWVTGT